MSPRTAAAVIASCLAVSLCGVLVAQELDSLEALLEDISSTSPITGETGMASGSGAIEGDIGSAEAFPLTEPELAAEAASAEVAEAPVEEVAVPAAEEAMETPAEAAVAEEAPLAPEPVVVEEAAPVAVEEAAPVLAEEPAPEAEPVVVLDELAPDVEPAAEETAQAVEEAAPVAEPGVFDFGAVATEEPTEPAVMEEEPAAEEETVEETAPEAEAEAAVDAPRKLTRKEAAQAAQQEEVRRQAREKDAKLAANRGQAALKNGDNALAIKELTAALADLPVRPANEQAIANARANLAQAHYKYAVEMFTHKNYAEARRNAEDARKLDPSLTYTKSLLKKVEVEEKKQAVVAARPVPVKKRPEYVSRKKDIAQLLAEGKQFYQLEDFNSAEALFEQVLLRDEYNIDAMRFLRRLDEKRYTARSYEREATQADMMQKVRDAWNPPIRQEVKMPEQVIGRSPQDMEGPAQKLQRKMENIIIPSIEFRQANIHDVVEFLVQASQAGDPDGVGVNILLKLEGGTTAPATAAPAAPAAGGFDEFGFPIESTAPPSDSLMSAPATTVPTITLNLRRISLLDAIKYITEVASLKFRVEENAVIIAPEGVASGKIITRLYPVQPSILDVIVEREDTGAEERQGEFIEMGARTTMKKSDVKDFFVKAGVPFPAGTSITYNQSISQLIVANTPENLENFERILSRLNVVPNQVEIEARFVEIAQDDLEELGLEWILTDDYEIAQKNNGYAGIAGTEQIKMLADEDGVTKGLRFFNVDRITGSTSPESTVSRGISQTPLGGIMTFASVLTNPELTVILHALAQSGGSDLLSAPRVTTRSGVNAQIQVVKEIIYPTEFEVTEPTISSTTVNLGTGASGGLVTPPTVTPGSFETRETGVILNVTPTVGPDGYTIDLTLAPEVAELVDWIQYGSTISAGGQTFTYNIPQPVFSSRNVTTSIVIWDGQTVVMGGLIREDLVKVKDKVPILGDIPFLGRLFRTEGESSRKANLLIFVTARLVDPSGKSIHRDTGTETDTAQAPAGSATP